MADRVAAELERHFKRSVFQGDDDLVFCHPHTGGPYDPSKMRERFKDTRDRAGLLQEWMGHRSAQTTEIYADYAPDPTQGAKFAEVAFGAGLQPGDVESPVPTALGG